MSFAPRSERDLVELVDEYPLAWVVSFSSDSGFNATPLPLLAETDAAGDIAVLVGHFALSNPQVTGVASDASSPDPVHGSAGVRHPRMDLAAPVGADLELRHGPI